MRVAGNLDFFDHDIYVSDLCSHAATVVVQTPTSIEVF